MTTEYRRLNRARSPLKIGLAGVGVGFLVFGLAYGAPWFWFIPIGLYLALTLYGLTQGDAAFTLSDSEIGWSLGRADGSGTARLPLDQIHRVEIVDWSDSTDTRVIRRDGTAITLPATISTGRRDDFLAALAARGIPVEIR